MNGGPRRGDPAIVYAVSSRRAGGLSVGVDLFPDGKRCSFDCPYCEVFPSTGDLRAPFTLAAMETALRSTLRQLRDDGTAVRDICFSGSGEPTLSPDLPAALEVAARLRAEEVPGAKLVLITNGSTLNDPRLAALLANAASTTASADVHGALSGIGLETWIKFDAGTEAWYRKIDRAPLPFAPVIAGIRSFVSRAPAVIQTMLCAIDGAPPPAEEAAAWLERAEEFARLGDNSTSGVLRFDLYGKARAAPEDPKASPLPLAALEERAAALRTLLRRPRLGKSLAEDRRIPPVRVFP